MNADWTTYEGPDSAEARQERDRVAAGDLPSRYAEAWGQPFFDAARPALRPGTAILDVGSGRRPTLPPSFRPPRSLYVGLDVSEAELREAEEGAYDQAVVGDVTSRIQMLENRFDLVLSWQVLEHVRSMADGLNNIRAYLRSGGLMVAQISGSFAAFSLLARALPHSVASRLMERLLGSSPTEKFPTHYDRCYATALQPLLASYSSFGIVPRFKGGSYFRFFRPLERSYLMYENLAERSGRPNLATHYVIWAIK